MKNYIVYDRYTGKIRKSGVCPESMMEIQGGGNYVVIEGTITNENTVIDGVPVYIALPPPPPPTQEEIAAKEEAKFYSEVLVVLAKAFFNHENRIRVLEGKSAITWEQFKAAIRGMM